MSEKPLEIIIPRRATTEHVRAIYSPDADALLNKLGTHVVTRRASHVEPTEELPDNVVAMLAEKYNVSTREELPRGWWAALIPSGGPVLGPFPVRDEAITAELKWLEEHNYPVCEPCARACYKPQIEPDAAEPIVDCTVHCDELGLVPTPATH